MGWLSEAYQHIVSHAIVPRGFGYPVQSTPARLEKRYLDESMVNRNASSFDMLLGAAMVTPFCAPLAIAALIAGTEATPMTTPQWMVTIAQSCLDFSQNNQAWTFPLFLLGVLVGWRGVARNN